MCESRGKSPECHSCDRSAQWHFGEQPAVVPVVTAPGQSEGPLCRVELLPELNLLPLFPAVVYPSLESDEDNPVFKSRSKKRKSSDDAPYSPTGTSVCSVLPTLRPSHANL